MCGSHRIVCFQTKSVALACKGGTLPPKHTLAGIMHSHNPLLQIFSSSKLAFTWTISCTTSGVARPLIMVGHKYGKRSLKMTTPPN